MRFRKNRLCKIFLLILFMAFISGGCGGGSSGSSSGNSQGNNGNGNSNGNNGGQSAEINGTWEIVSGRGVTSTDVNGRIDVSHVTYAQGKNSEVYIEMSKSDSYFGDYFSTTLRGEDVNAGGIKGNGLLTVFCTLDDHNNDEAFMVIPGGFAYEYIGNGTYRMTNETYDKAVENMQNNNSGRVRTNAGEYENIMTLKDDSTLSWTYWYKNTIGSFTTEYRYEIVLKRSGSSYDPNDYTDNNTNINNNNSNGDNNTSPTPSPDNNTSQPDTPPQTNDTWEITSGSGLISQNISGRVYVSHLTYTPRITDKGFTIDITQNDISTYYGEHVGLFSVTLTGDNVINSGIKGSGAIRVSYSVAETPGSEASATFTGGKSFSYIGDGTYRMTTSSGEHDITLESSSTIRWKYTAFTEGWYEIVLTKQQ